MNKLVNFTFEMPRVYKRLVSVCVDSLFIMLAFFGAYWARLGESYYTSTIVMTFIAVLVFTLFVFTYLGLYRAVLRYLSFHVFISLFLGAGISAISIGAV